MWNSYKTGQIIVFWVKSITEVQKFWKSDHVQISQFAIKVLLYAPIVNYSQYSKERHWIFRFGLEKDLKQFLRSLDIYLKKKKFFWVHLRGVRQPPNMAKTPIFRGLPDPLQVDPQFFFHFSFRYMSRDLRNCFKFFSSPNIKIQWRSLEYWL